MEKFQIKGKVFIITTSLLVDTFEILKTYIRENEKNGSCTAGLTVHMIKNWDSEATHQL